MNEIESAHKKVLEAIDQIVRVRRNVPTNSYVHKRLQRSHDELSVVRKDLEFTFHWLDQHGYGEKTENETVTA